MNNLYLGLILTSTTLALGRLLTVVAWLAFCSYTASHQPDDARHLSRAAGQYLPGRRSTPRGCCAGSRLSP